MLFNKIELKNFRNIKEARFDISPSLTILIGKNGQGKTNLIEALYLLIQGMSFRPAKTEHFINDDSSMALVRASVSHEGKSDQITLQIKGAKKAFFLNEKKTSSNRLAKIYPCVLFSPESLDAIKNGPEYRRNLVEEMLTLVDNSAVDVINSYRKILKQRNALLRSVAKRQYSVEKARETMESLNEIFVDSAAELSHLRMKSLHKIEPFVEEALRSITSLKDISFKSHYYVSGADSREWDKGDFDAALRYRLNELSEREWAVGSSLIGPHKHEIVFEYQGKDSRYSCSQGQQRTLILAFKIAQIVYHSRIHGDYPILLLDDVLSELDEERRSYLVEFLRNCEAQTLVSTTDLNLSKEIKEKDLKIYHVSGGQFSSGIEEAKLELN